MWELRVNHPTVKHLRYRSPRQSPEPSSSRAPKRKLLPAGKRRRSRVNVTSRLLDSDIDRVGGDTVRHHYHPAGARFHVRRHVEVGEGRRRTGDNAHGAVVMRTRIEHVTGGDVGDSHQRIIRRRLELVAEVISLRPAVELPSEYRVALAARNRRRENGDDRRQK